MTSTAGTTPSTSAPDPDPSTPRSAREHDTGHGTVGDPGDATVTEQPAPSRFTDRAAAKAARAADASAPATATAPATASAPAEPTAPTTPTEPTARVRRSPDLKAGVRRAASLTKTVFDRLRTVLGEVVWFACVLAAVALLLGVAVVVLEANTRNALVEWVLKAADWADLGVFSRTGGIKQFTGDNAVVKNAFVNWGLGAVAWLVVGRVTRRILTP